MAGEEPEMDGDIPKCDILEVLVATDIHLGYDEKDPERGDDSFNSFEEILKIAQTREVDFVLLGGDLFHDNKPSPKCIHRCLKLLRQYCLGDKPIRVEFLSDQSENFQHCDFPIVNYEDPNYNISIPVFSIHGNHDDPSGYGRLSSLDICSVTNLINYFGKWTDLTKVEVSPILLRKGVTNVALYGLSYIKDDRLARLFRDQNVKFWQPSQNAQDWFNIFICHQNRADRGVNKYLPESAIPPFIDFVIWGHEHECRIEEEFNSTQSFHVTQPGSPVATSLCEGEAKPKHIGLLQIYKQKHRFTPIKLQSVRPFVFDSVILSEHDLDFGADSVTENVELFLKDKVKEMITLSKEQQSRYEKQPKLPLIRLRVEWSMEDQAINAIRFGQVYYGNEVANPDDMILLRREKMDKKKIDKAIDPDVLENILDQESESLQTVLERYFTEVQQKNQLKVLSVKGLGEALSRYVDRGDRTAINDLKDHQVEKTVNFLKRRDDVNEDSVLDVLEEYRLVRLEKAKDDVAEAREVLESASRTQSKVVDDDDDEPMLQSDGENGNDSDVNGDVTAKVPSKRGGRGSRGGGAKAEPTARGRGRGRGRGARGASTTARGAKQTTLTATRPASARQNRSRITYDEISDSD